MIKIRNIYRKVHKKFPLLVSNTLINRTTKEIQANIKKIFQDNFRNKLNNIVPDKSNIHKSIRLIKPSKSANISLSDNTGIILDPKLISNKIADYYEGIYDGEITVDESIVNNKVCEYVSAINNNPNNSNNLSTCLSEVMEFVRTLKNKKSPGSDGVTNRAIKNLPYSGVHQLVLITNAIISFNYFPNCWKTSKIIPIPKPGKTGKPENTRPISLLSGLSKLVERIIHKRLWEVVEKWIPDEQFGFVYKKSTNFALMRVLNILKNSKMRRKTTFGIFLDIKKAFDSVWHNGLIFKMINCNIPSQLILLTKSYLSDRKFYVSTNNTNSNVRNMVAGVPQGSVLGPLLYVFFMHDIPIPSSPQTKLQIYADDTAIFITSYSAYQCSIRLQAYLNTLMDYYKNWNICINPTKTQLVHFYPTSRYQNKLKSAVPITINGHSIEIVRSAKYLGITLTNNLKFGPHIQDLKKKTAMAFNTLYPILNYNSGLDCKNKLLVYKLYIRPIFTYAIPSWYDLANKSEKDCLQKFQNKALRFVFNAWPRPPYYQNKSTNYLHDLAQILKIEDFSAKMTSNSICRLLSIDNDMLNEIAHQH